MMNVKDKHIDFPRELREKYNSLELEAINALEVKDFILAENKYRELISAILDFQGRDKRYHKGGPYHQIGYCLFLQNKSAEAFKYFLYAYVEDSITESNIPLDLPAFKNLKYAYGISVVDLDDLFKDVRASVNTNIPQKSDDYLEEYFSRGKNIKPIDITKDKKVFVGGNYRNIALLRHIEEVVSKISKSSLIPILPVNFSEVSEQKIYQHSMFLLEDCKHAIFEVTFDAGHLMEIEHALKKEHNILLLYQKKYKNDQESPPVTKMLLGHEVKVESYTTIEDLEKAVSGFISTIGPQARS